MNFKTTSITAIFTGLSLLSGCSNNAPKQDMSDHFLECERAATAAERTRIKNKKFSSPNGLIFLVDTPEDARRSTIIKCLQSRIL